MRKNLNQSGFAHAGLAIFAVIAVMAIGLVGYNVSNQSSENTDVLGAKSSKKSVKINKKGRITPGGTVQFVVKEQVIKNGKKTLVARGNVPVQLTATNDHQACRDAGKMYVRKNNVVFAGQTDADKSHKTNLGKIKVDRCLVGKYNATLQLSDKYVFVGEKTKQVNVKKGSTKKVSFVIAKATPASADTDSQSKDVVPSPAPAPSTTSPLSQAEEVKAIDTTNKYEDDMFFNIIKSCEKPDEDLGEKIAIRKAAFEKHASGYMTPALISKVNTTHGGDGFALLGVSDIKCAQYSYLEIKESKPLVTSGTPNSAVVEHRFTAKARAVPTDGYPKLNDVVRTWVYSLQRDGNLWKISSIEVKSN